MGNVGLFFYVNGKLLTDLIDIDHAEFYGDFIEIDRTDSHYVCKKCNRNYYE